MEDLYGENRRKVSCKITGCHQEKEETKVEIQAKTDKVQPCESVAIVEYKYNFSCYLMMLNVCVSYKVSTVYKYE
jgi:hypothetical protein